MSKNNHSQEFNRFTAQKNKRVLLFAGGSTGSIFLHSLINDTQGILSIPTIFNSIGVYNQYKKSKHKDLQKILKEKTKLNLIFEGVSSYRHGDFSGFNDFNKNIFFKCLHDISKSISVDSPLDISNLVNFCFMKATNQYVDKDTVIFEHPHNLSEDILNKFNKYYDNPTFIVSVRNPIYQVPSFFSYISDNKLNYQEITKRLLSLMNVTLEYSKHQKQTHIFRLEDLNNNPEQEIKRLQNIFNTNDLESLKRSQFGGRDYVATSPNNGLVSGFNSIKKKKINISPSDQEFLEFFFYHQFDLFNYRISNNNINQKRINIDFMGIKPKGFFERFTLRALRKKNMMSRYDDISKNINPQTSGF